MSSWDEIRAALDTPENADLYDGWGKDDVRRIIAKPHEDWDEEEAMCVVIFYLHVFTAMWPRVVADHEKSSALMGFMATIFGAALRHLGEDAYMPWEKATLLAHVMAGGRPDES